jgi:charged multivesicular body protein 4A/B
MNLFGKAKQTATPKDAIIKLRESLEMLEKREKYLDTKIAAELSTAKLNATKNKRGKQIERVVEDFNLYACGFSSRL